MVMFNHCVLVPKEFCWRQFLPVVAWVNLKIEEKKEWKRNEIMGGYIIVCKNDFIVGVITMFLNRFVHAARIICSRWYVVSTSAEKDEKKP